VAQARDESGRSGTPPNPRWSATSNASISPASTGRISMGTRSF
jgi:hypothetical protein